LPRSSFYAWRRQEERLDPPPLSRRGPKLAISEAAVLSPPPISTVRPGSARVTARYGRGCGCSTVFELPASGCCGSCGKMPCCRHTTTPDRWDAGSGVPPSASDCSNTARRLPLVDFGRLLCSPRSEARIIQNSERDDMLRQRSRAIGKCVLTDPRKFGRVFPRREYRRKSNAENLVDLRCFIIPARVERDGAIALRCLRGGYQKSLR
jgi:hypothetical protein